MTNKITVNVGRVYLSMFWVQNFFLTIMVDEKKNKTKIVTGSPGLSYVQ